MKDITDPITRLTTALQSRGGDTSDFDLNPSVRLPEGRTLKEAAVLVLFDDAGRLYLTKRAAHLKHHPGQIAFAGGRRDPEDESLVDTALREANEEIGLPRDAVNILGTLPTHETISSYVVTPIVAHLTRDFDVVPEPGEVDQVFTVPFSHISNTDNFRIQSRRFKGQPRYYYTVPYGPFYIWGATARILRGLAGRLCD